MKVSIRQALKNVASDKYDKKNIFLFLTLFFIPNLLSLFLPEALTDKNIAKTLSLSEFLALFSEPYVIVTLLICFVLGLIYNGCFIVATNNAINSRDKIFPNPYKEAGNLIVKSFLYFSGSIIILAMVITLPILLCKLLVEINPWLLLSLIPIIFILVHGWLCVNFRFYMTLNFKDWFSFKTSWIMIAKILRRFASFISKALVLYIFVFGIMLFIYFIFSGLLIALISVKGDIKIIETAIYIIILLLQTIVCGFLSIYIIDLTAQLLSPIVKEEEENIIKL